MWARRHPRRLHQYMQICGLDPGNHEEQLTDTFCLRPLGSEAPLTPRALTPPLSPSPAPSLPGLGILFLKFLLQPVLVRTMALGKREHVTIWNKHNITRGGVTSVCSGTPSWLRREGRPISSSTHRCRNRDQGGRGLSLRGPAGMEQKKLLITVYIRAIFLHLTQWEQLSTQSLQAFQGSIRTKRG